ncbi:unnamed protein product [Didymodactylos carnosus]|uniref:PX domain-containing protein n=1 Tax=Didymodactylos carnosus TaxID=1234261 RepID=A0A813WER0_9BILA|nr:unnamed protein product [Didymodactylos carnosus]CAF0853938.1 unnamed protein product [Didymodactylos carnosus]CAF3570662.1 unnamed protein product [Didymodactylos carnosus]CAF3641524.1 unnamed protein product [Didymodactylos carnosus]
MSEETLTLFDRYDISITNTERRNTSSISIQDCYIVYLIECRPRTHCGSSEIESTCVFRRYSDFETLRNYLTAKYSWIIVPVLPEKTISHTWSKSHQDRTSVEVVERRRLLLERFLHHLCGHPTLSSDSAVQNFVLQNDGWKQIVDISHVLNKRMADRLFTLYQAHNMFGRLFSDWSGTEDKLGDSLQRAGHYLDSFSGQIEEFLHEEDALMDFIKQQATYCEVIRGIVEKHEQLIEDTQKYENNLGVKKTQRDAYANGKMNFSVNALKAKLFGDNQDTRYAKIECMDADINDATLHCQNAEVKLNEFNKNAVTELEFYKNMKEDQFRDILRAYCLLQARICKTALKSWTNIRDCFTIEQPPL